MEYYRLSHNTDSKISGIYPQAECISLGKAHSIRFDEFPEHGLKLDFLLASKAKLTDVLSQAAISAHGFLISSKLKKLLENFTLLNYRFYEVTLTTNKGDETYYWLHLVDENLVQYIDFSRSKFFRTEFGFWEEDITLGSYPDFRERKRSYGMMGNIHATHLHLNNNFDRNLDLFLIADLHTKVYIKETLYAELLTQKITGLDIQKAGDISFE